MREGGVSLVGYFVRIGTICGVEHPSVFGACGDTTSNIGVLVQLADCIVGVIIRSFLRPGVNVYSQSVLVYC